MKTDNQFLIDYDAPKDEIVLNGSIKTKGSCSLKSEKDQDQTKIIVTGTLVTEYYEDRLETIESSRYFINKIDVYSESFNSENDYITYEFSAQIFVIKYQVEDIEEASKDE